jgi:hypothetical protein
MYYYVQASGIQGEHAWRSTYRGLQRCVTTADFSDIESDEDQSDDDTVPLLPPRLAVRAQALLETRALAGKRETKLPLRYSE